MNNIEARFLAHMAYPMPTTREDIGAIIDGVTYFDPWEAVFPMLYGSYNAAFDRCALTLLCALQDQRPADDDLTTQVLQELLCTQGFCIYGSSPRACFPSLWFKLELPALIKRWSDVSLLQWERN